MSSLLGKLGRLDRLREARGAASVAAPPDAKPASAATSSPAPGERWVESVGTRLDFAVEPSDHGSLHVRRLAERPRHTIGRVPLGAALEADVRLLARLCLAPEVEGLPLERALFLDTETSGLGGGTGNRAFLVGMSFFEPASGSFVLEQLLLRDPDDEAALLEQVKARLEASAFVVSYNGKSFDVPLLRARMTMARVGPLPERPHLDLLHVARRVHDRRAWRKSLGVVEREVLGFERGPDVHGEEVALRYAEYMFTGDEGCLREVVEHNRHDVWSLVALLGHYGRAGGASVGGLQGFATPELTGMARTLSRAGDLDWAGSLAEQAVVSARAELGPVTAGSDEADALWTRARIAKSRGDKRAALADLERLAEDLDDPEVRLELAKLYEHSEREPQRALEVASRGTGEAPDDLARRLARLRRKVDGKRR